MMIQITSAAHMLAQLRARQAVKRELQKQGLKPAHYAAREISSWAQVYLEDHMAELMPEAIARARAMIASGALGKRAQRALCAKLESDAQTQKA
jgi:predicted DNA-binding protein (MmcQ/YjbR family)